MENIEIELEEYKELLELKIKYNLLVDTIIDSAEYIDYSKKLTFDDSSIRMFMNNLESKKYKDKIKKEQESRKEKNK